jgi:hypothetical protein
VNGGIEEMSQSYGYNYGLAPVSSQNGLGGSIYPPGNANMSYPLPPNGGADFPPMFSTMQTGPGMDGFNPMGRTGSATQDYTNSILDMSRLQANTNQLMIESQYAPKLNPTDQSSTTIDPSIYNPAVDYTAPTNFMNTLDAPLASAVATYHKAMNMPIKNTKSDNSKSSSSSSHDYGTTSRPL